MQAQPRLVDARVPSDPQAAVLVLHGGASRGSNMMVSPTQLSVLRMIPIASRIARAGGSQLAVFRLLNSVRGWDSTHTPVDDALWAMGQLRERFGKALPLSLVGHSLGGRAALLAGGAPDVKSVVALAPWVYPTDGEAGLPGRDVLIVHGTADRIASPERSATVARALSTSTRVGYIRVKGGKHAMLGRHAVFGELAADFVIATLLGATVGGPVSQVLAGAAWIDV